MTILHFAVVGISFLCSLSALRNILFSKEGRSVSESYRIPSFISMLLIPSSSFVFDWSDRADTSCVLQTHCPRRAHSGGTASPGGSRAPRRCSWVFAPLEGAHGFEELNLNSSSIFRQNAATDKRGGLLSSWKTEEMLVPEPSLLLGKAFSSLLCFSPRCPGLLPPIPGAGMAMARSALPPVLVTTVTMVRALLEEGVQHDVVWEGEFPTAEQTGKTDGTTKQLKKVVLRHKVCFGYCFVSNNWPYHDLHSYLALEKSAFSQIITLLRKLLVYKKNNWGVNWIPYKKVKNHLSRTSVSRQK